MHITTEWPNRIWTKVCWSPGPVLGSQRVPTVPSPPQTSSISIASITRNFFRMQVLEPQPLWWNQKLLGVGPSNRYFHKPSRAFWCKFKFENLGPRGVLLPQHHDAWEWCLEGGNQCSPRHRREPNTLTGMWRLISFNPHDSHGS